MSDRLRSNLWSAETLQRGMTAVKVQPTEALALSQATDEDLMLQFQDGVLW